MREPSDELRLPRKSPAAERRPGPRRRVDKRRHLRFHETQKLKAEHGAKTSDAMRSKDYRKHYR